MLNLSGFRIENPFPEATAELLFSFLSYTFQTMQTKMNKDLNIHHSVSELELMQRIFESDFDAIEVLYDKYSPLLFTFIKKILKDGQLAEDVLVDIFSIIQKRINYFDFNSKNPYTWLMTLTKNRAVYELRKKTGMKENTSDELQEEYITPKLSYLTESLELDKAFGLKNNIESALNKLTDAQQYVIYLAFYEGLTQEEIAEKLKIPLSTVKSKVKTSLITLNENFKGKSSLFTVKNEIVELIYPFVLGCLSNEEQVNTYNRFKDSEPFPWKLLGEYQNLVALLPVILELEKPSEEGREKILNRIYHIKSMKKEDKIKSFERVSSTSSQLKIPIEEEIAPKEKFERVEKLDEEEIRQEKRSAKGGDEFEPVVPFKPAIERSKPEEFTESRKRNYSSIIIIGLIVFYVASAVMAYLFYQDRALFYETEIENLKSRIETLSSEYQNRPEIPGLGELRNPRIVDLTNSNGAISNGEIIFSYEDKRGYLHIKHLPILDSDNGYQLWGNFNGNFLSLGVFKVSSRPDYFPFTLPESVNEGPIEFYLIESNAAGSRRPGSKIYLKGKTE